jgi:hypothetical protein
MLIWIVFDEDKARVLAVFDSRQKGLEFIAKAKNVKDSLCLISETVK